MRIIKKKTVRATPPADRVNKRKKEQDLKFISESQQLSGFRGKFSRDILKFEPDMKRIAKSARRFGAQVPMS
ncbi:MAG: hypothetical protein V9H26_05090 [Verrucomicrobiota bacterium]